MNHSQLAAVLTYFTQKIAGKDIFWYLEGSANLVVQGVPVVANDVDITTTRDDYVRIKKLINLPLTEKHEPKKLKHAFDCVIDGVALEIAWYEHSKKPFCHHPEDYVWNELHLHIAPLTYTIEFYDYIGKSERAELIRHYLQSNL